MPARRASVLLCTYNGAKHLEAQFASYAAQTRRPDAIVVNDDRSTDGTVALLRELGERYELPVDVVVNERNLGFAANFAAVLGRVEDRAPNHLLFLSDQDDAWRPTKIERLAAEFDDADVQLAFSDSELADAELRPTGKRFLAGLSFDPARLRREPLDALLHRNYVQGAACAVRASLVDAIVPLPAGWWHDHWLACVAACAGKLAYVDEPLNLYRQHAGQALGGVAKPLHAQVASAADPAQTAGYHEGVLTKYEALRARVERLPLRPGARALLDARVAFSRARVRMRARPWLRAPLALGELARGRYGRFAQGWRSFAYDLWF